MHRQTQKSTIYQFHSEFTVEENECFEMRTAGTLFDCTLWKWFICIYRFVYEFISTINAMSLFGILKQHGLSTFEYILWINSRDMLFPIFFFLVLNVVLWNEAYHNCGIFAAFYLYLLSSIVAYLSNPFSCSPQQTYVHTFTKQYQKCLNKIWAINCSVKSKFREKPKWLDWVSVCVCVRCLVPFPSSMEVDKAHV